MVISLLWVKGPARIGKSDTTTARALGRPQQQQRSTIPSMHLETWCYLLSGHSSRRGHGEFLNHLGISLLPRSTVGDTGSRVRRENDEEASIPSRHQHGRFRARSTIASSLVLDAARLLSAYNSTVANHTPHPPHQTTSMHASHAIDLLHNLTTSMPGAAAIGRVALCDQLYHVALLSCGLRLACCSSRAGPEGRAFPIQKPRKPTHRWSKRGPNEPEDSCNIFDLALWFYYSLSLFLSFFLCCSTQ